MFHLLYSVNMARKSYAQTISDAQVMVKGIKDNEAKLSQRKINGAFADSMKTDIDTCIRLNNEQESLKARLKEKTEELNATMTLLKKKASEARKVIKMDIPQSLWREFGIEDKR